MHSLLFDRIWAALAPFFRKGLCLVLALAIFLQSIPITAEAQTSETCKNGSCVEQIVHRLEDLGKLYKEQCLPKKESLSEVELRKWHEKEGVSESCWQLMTEITSLEDQLSKAQAVMESDTLACMHPGLPGVNSIEDLDRLERELSCNEDKKKKIRGQCGDDVQCALFASALGIGGYIAEKVIPSDWKPNKCHLGDDSCVTQFATAFLKAVVSFFESAWDLLKAGGKYVGKKAGQFWDWVSGADNHASTSQLALAKASEEEGVFDMLVKDFSGTMGKIFSGLVAALKEWFKTDVFCQAWSGVPHFSTCTTPTDNFDCLSCKAMINGLCAMTGTIVAEIIPAFLTGGLVSAAKHGANGAGKIAKVFKVSARAMEAMKGTRVGKYAASAATKLDEVLRVSKNIKIARAALATAAAAARLYLASPLRKVLKASHTVLLSISKKGAIFLAETKAGKVIVFGAKATKAAGKVVLYPIDNPMTTWAFKAGERTFEKALTLGAPRLAPTTAVTSAIIEADIALEKAVAKMHAMKMSNKSSAKILAQEEKVLELALAKRAQLTEGVLAEQGTTFDDIVSNLYPELGYGKLAEKLGPEKVLAAEKELLAAIDKMPAGPAKEAMLKRFHAHTAPGVARNKLLGTNDATEALTSYQDASIVVSAKSDPKKLEALNGFIEKAKKRGTKIDDEFMQDLIKLEGPHTPKDVTAFLKKYPKVKREELLSLAKKDVGILGREDVAAVKPKAPEATAPIDPTAASKSSFVTHYGMEDARAVEALGLPTKANNRAYLQLAHGDENRKVVAFSSENAVLKDGNDILGREAMTAAENMYQESFMDVLRHDQNGMDIWRSMSRTDGGVLREVNVTLSKSHRKALVQALEAKKGSLSVTQEKLLEKLSKEGSTLSAEETALLYRMFPDKARLLSGSVTKKQAQALKKMFDDLDKDTVLTGSEKNLKDKLLKAASGNGGKLNAEELSILDGMSTRIYSGFKSIEGAVDWDTYKLVLAERMKVAPETLDDATVAAHLKADLQALDKEVKSRFSVKMKDAGFDTSSAKGKMSGNRIQNFSDWKAMGVSKIPPDGTGSAMDEAAMAARSGRSEGKPLAVYDDVISRTVVSKVRTVEGAVGSPGLRKQFLTSIGKRGVTSEKLVESGFYAKIPDEYLTSMGHAGPRPQYVFSEKVWSVVRKSGDLDEITKRLNSLFPYLELTKDEARMLRSHYEALDALSPAIHAESRGSLPVSMGLGSGGVLDVQGLGALNAQWNDAASLVSSLNGKTEDAGVIISAVRSAEVNGSTPAYKLRVDSMVKAVKEELPDGYVVRVSGDDIVFYPERRVTPDRRDVLRGDRRADGSSGVVSVDDISEKDINKVVKGLDRLAKKGLNTTEYGGSSLSRATFVRGPGAEEAHITMLETLEKNLRKELEAEVKAKAITLDALSSTVIGFDAMVPTAGDVVIRVVIPKDSTMTTEMLMRYLEGQKSSLSSTLKGRPFSIKVDRI